MEDISYISSDSEDENINNDEINIIEEQDKEYYYIIDLLNTIKDYRYNNNPLILDKMSSLNFFNFIDLINLISNPTK